MSLSTLWLQALHSHPPEHIHTLIKQLGTHNKWSIRPKVLPETGLGMLQLTDSALQENYNLGEFPLSTAWVEIVLADGNSAEGAAQVMDDRIQVAEDLAVCDAVLRHRLPGFEQVEQAVTDGLDTLAQQNRERHTMLTRTRVDFSLLDSVDDD